MKIKLKICGFTNHDDLSHSVDIGIDAAGFVFAEGPRKITIQQAQEIQKGLPHYVAKIGVFVDPDIAFLKEVAAANVIDAIQLHGQETTSFCREAMCIRPVIKTFHVGKDDVLFEMDEYEDCVDKFLLDTYVEGQPGGTGKTFDWNIAVEARKKNRKLILAGGLNPDNIFEAMKTVRPYAVDLSSGVEKSPGVKDWAKITSVAALVRKFNEEWG
jgi:phosphoribosylanthranilate isomerase